jgi:putative transposase
MPKLRHYDDLGTVRFVTFTCYRMGKNFDNTLACELLTKQIQDARAKHRFKLLAYVIMPEHAHMVLLPPYRMKLGLVIGEIKSRMAREYFALTMPDISGTRVFWYKRCYDHNCRTPESVKEKINYCHYNPVNRGLVKNPGDYKWSSYNWYQGKKDVPLTMDEVEF